MKKTLFHLLGILILTCMFIMAAVIIGLKYKKEQMSKYIYIKTVNDTDIYYNNETNRMYFVEDNKYKELWIIDENEIRPAYYPND